MMQTWAFAYQTSNENLMSAVPVVLALLLKLLSRSLDTVPYGLGICRTLLQKRQLELISKNLSADKGKAFIVSPTLRMLREAMAFDGGAIAKPLFRARASTFKSLARNMGIIHMGEEPEMEDRPSTRTTAIYFFLCALKFLHPEAKRELLSQRDIVAALTRDIKQDPIHLVLEMLSTFRDGILLDDKIPREAKGNLFNVSTLVRISSLYQYRRDPDSTQPSVADAAHEFLLAACTRPSGGILRQDTGLYPRDIDPDAVLPTADIDELGLEAMPWMDKYKSEVPVRNFVLSNLLQNLRPWSSVKQNELVTAIFRAAPELVASFFFENKSFAFEPKLTATWIGYAAFLFNTVLLPIPDHFSRGSGFPQLPPPTSVVLGTILPLPLTQKALVRCLTSKSKLVSFFATRILVVAIEKLDAAVKMHHADTHANKALWAEAARRLVDEFCQRIPGMKDMIQAYRSIPEEDALHREAGSRLLRLCYAVIPQVALLAKFDVSPLLDASLGRLARDEAEDPKDFALGLKELENLLAIAGFSPGMRWFSASDALVGLAPFTVLLRVCIDAPSGIALEEIFRVLGFVAAEQQVVLSREGHPGLLPLVEALQGLSREMTAYVWPFLDNCLSRCAAAPVKYLEVVQTLAEEVDGLEADAFISPLIATMLEQLPFAVKAGDKDLLAALGKFLPKFLGLSATVGESKPLLDGVYSKISHIFKEGQAKLAHKRIPDAVAFKHNVWPPRGKATRTTDRPSAGRKYGNEDPAMDAEELEGALAVTDGLTADHSALTKWVTKTADEIVDDGHATGLVVLLASEHASIRQEALVNLQKMAAKVRESEYEDKDQVWLLLSELVETARAHNVAAAPLPSPAVAFACHALRVLRDPLSSLYAKVNGFLTRGPVWNLGRLPLVDEILLEDPDIGDSYYAQVNWLLGYLVDALRTPQDLELFHKRRQRGPVLQRLLALAANPYMRLPLRTQLLRLLYKATGIEGGSTTLTTRFGVVNWLEEQEKACLEAKEGGSREAARLYRALRGRVWQTCDRGRVGLWSKGGVEELCQALQPESMDVD
jgi:nucleolar pre-ribosomal-associated protein 1